MAFQLLDSAPFEISARRAEGDSPLTVERLRLPNGLTLLFVEDHSAPVFAYQTWFDVGSANETPGKTGIAHLFEHLMFKATRKHPDGELDRVMERRGGSSNAATWVDWTFYTSGLPSRGDNLEVIAGLEADRMVGLILDDPQVEAEREVVLNERRYRVDNSPDGLASEALYAAAFRCHPYRWPTIGWEEDIRAITREDALAFYRVWYAPNNATLVIVGDLERGRVLSTVERAYGLLSPQPVAEERLEEEPSVEADRRKELQLAIEAEKLLVAWRAPGLTDPKRPALLVLESILFAGSSARVKRRLVDEEAIALDVGSMLTPFKHPGLLEVKVEMKEEHRAEEAEEAILEEVSRLADTGPGEEELEKARNQVELAFLGGLRTASEKAEALGSMHLTGGDYRRLFLEVPAVQAVTAAEVIRAASELMRPGNRVVVAGRPQRKGP